VALRSVLGPLVAAASGLSGKPEYGPSSAVDSLLAWYCRHRYLTPIEGGMYWMTGPLRDDIYSANSRYTDTATVCEVFSGDGLKDAYPTVAQLVLLALHHDRIARQYYFETFVQSKDPQAFFEYVYHRVSSIRYLTKLDLLLKSLGPNHPDVERVCALLRGTVYHDPSSRLDTDPSSPDLGLPVADAELLSSSHLHTDPSSREGLTNAAQFHQQIQVRRAREIASLSLGWISATEVLSAQVPAEQLISWCRWVVEDDLPRFCTYYYLVRAEEEKRVIADMEGWQQRCKELDRRVLASRSRLRDALFTLWVRCCRERGDHPAMRQAAGTHLRLLLEELEEWLEGPPVPPDLKQALPGFKEALKDLAAAAASTTSPGGDALLRLVRCLLEAAPTTEEGTLWQWLRGAGNRAWPRQLFSTLLDLAESQLAAPREPPDWLGVLGGALLEAEERKLGVRLVLLRAECHWRRVSFHGERVGPSLTGSDKAHIVHLRRCTEEGLTAIRPSELPEEQASEQYSYFYHRTRLLLYRGRSAWLSALAEPDGPRREERFKEAYRDFELARGRLDAGPGPTFLAQIDLAAAESVLAQAGAEPAPPLARVGAKLDLVDGYLRRALDHLMHGRRNVIWWREYHRLRAQYKADRNLWRLCKLLEASPGGGPRHGEGVFEFWDRVGPVMRRFNRTLRQGFRAIGYGRDLELPCGPDGSPTPWLTRTYWELVFTALCMGVVVLRWPFTTGTESGPDPVRDPDQLQQYIEDLASRNGAPLQGERPAELRKVREMVTEHLIARGPLDSPRQRILELAATAAARSRRGQ
jgi:hypothetical protein